MRRQRIAAPVRAWYTGGQSWRLEEPTQPSLPDVLFVVRNPVEIQKLSEFSLKVTASMMLGLIFNVPNDH